MLWIDDDVEDRELMGRFFSEYIDKTSLAVLAKAAVEIQPAIEPPVGDFFSVPFNTNKCVSEEYSGADAKVGEIFSSAEASVEQCFNNDDDPHNFFYILEINGELRYKSFQEYYYSSFGNGKDWPMEKEESYYKITVDDNFIRAFWAHFKIDLRNFDPYALRDQT